MNQHRIIERADKMAASGRITNDEAARLRATDGGVGPVIQPRESPNLSTDV